MIHRLVAYTYIPNPEKLPQVNHKNNIKTDNKVENLKWGTTLSNSHEAFADGLYNIRKGSELTHSKLNEAQVLFIKNIYNDKSFLQKELADLFNISKAVMNNILKNKIWKHV